MQNQLPIKPIHFVFINIFGFSNVIARLETEFLARKVVREAGN
jgi:hypothetical protein